MEVKFFPQRATLLKSPTLPSLRLGTTNCPLKAFGQEWDMPSIDAGETPNGDNNLMVIKASSVDTLVVIATLQINLRYSCNAGYRASKSGGSKYVQEPDNISQH